MILVLVSSKLKILAFMSLSSSTNAMNSSAISLADLTPPPSSEEALVSLGYNSNNT